MKVIKKFKNFVDSFKFQKCVLDLYFEHNEKSKYRVIGFLLLLMMLASLTILSETEFKNRLSSVQTPEEVIKIIESYRLFSSVLLPSFLLSFLTFLLYYSYLYSRGLILIEKNVITLAKIKEKVVNDLEGFTF